jgi:hypothetical protein
VPVEQASRVDRRRSMRPLHNGQNPVPEGKLEIRHPVPVTDSATFTTPEACEDDLGDLLLEVLPPDGSTKALLKRYKHPPDQEAAAIELVLQQTEIG